MNLRSLLEVAAIVALPTIHGCSSPPEKRVPSTNGSSHPPEPGAPPRAGRIVWTVNVTAPVDVPSFTFSNVSSAAAGPGARPIIEIAGGRIATDHEETAVVPDDLSSDGEPIYAVEGRDSTEIRTVSGERYAIPLSASTRRARWYDLAPGVLSVARSDGGIIVSRYDHSAASPTWTRTIEMRGVVDAMKVGSLSNGAFVIIGATESMSGLYEVALGDGSTRTVTPALPPRAAVALSEATNSFAAVAPARADCAYCPRVEIHNLKTGELLRSFELPDPATATAMVNVRSDNDIGNDSLGFDGRLLWMYSYTPEHASDTMGTRFAERCGYEVYDTAHDGARVRDLSRSSGSWSSLSKSCRVRALIPTADGGAIAVAIAGERMAKIVKFDSPP